MSIKKAAFYFAVAFVASFFLFRVMGERYHLEDDFWYLRDQWTGKLYYAKNGQWHAR